MPSGLRAWPRPRNGTRSAATRSLPRDGFYDLRITGELWETYYYDSLRLMTVDHPAGTEIFTDERFVVPPVKLAVTAMRNAAADRACHR